MRTAGVVERPEPRIGLTEPHAPHEPAVRAPTPDSPIATPIRNTGAPAPIYVVCSPSRRVGKTLLARLLHDHYAANGRSVAAFDLADESPRLTDFLGEGAEAADITGIRGQMAFFDGLIIHDGAPKIIDVGSRQFAEFFTIARKIELFEEARRRALEPLILFMIDPDPKAERAYEMLRHWFAGISLLPVRNLMVAKGLRYGAAFRHASTLAVSIEIPVLAPAARALIERERFSFARACTRAPNPLGLARREDELYKWVRRLRLQFREIELGLIREQIFTALR